MVNVLSRLRVHTFVAAIFSYCCLANEVTVVDDTGQTITLAAQAERIISLSPHATELLFSAQAGKKLVGVIEYSNFPQEAKAIQRVGDYFAIDIELMLTLKPDLIVAWQSGIKPELLSRLNDLGFPVFLSEPKSFEDIAGNVERLAKLAGTTDGSMPVVKQFVEDVNALKNRYLNKARIKGFYQIWHDPLQTLNGEHFISQALALCAVDNVFAGQKLLAPLVNEESIIALNPQVIFSGGNSQTQLNQLKDYWRKWSVIDAVKNDHLFVVNSDWVARPTFRLLDAAKSICQQSDKVR